MKRFSKYLLATIVCIFALVATADAQNYHIRSSSGANMRQGPGTDQAIVARVPQGANVRVIERTNSNWVKVEYQGQTGYVASDLVKEGSARSSSSSSGNRSSSNGNRQSSSSGSRSNSGSSARSSSSAYQHKNIGLGLRFGDPAGITFKKYGGNNTAWEVNLGRSYRWGYRYHDRFYRYDRFHNRRAYYYRGHHAEPTVALQVHWLKHHNLSNDGALQFYFGLGPQARFTNVYYRYRYDNRDYYERFTDVDLGIDGVLGLEWTIPNAPLSLFFDVNAFVEVFDAPGWIHGQSGIGIRYNFR